MKKPSKTNEHDPFPFPIEPLRSSLSKNQRKTLDTHSSDSEINSQLALVRSPALSPATPIKTSNPYPFTSKHAQVNLPSPKGPFSPIQQHFCKSAKLRPKEPKHNRRQPNHPDSQSVLRTCTRQGYSF